MSGYEFPGIEALNFVLIGRLGAGGTASLRFDPEGKSVAQSLPDMRVVVPAAFSSHPASRA